jgi:hypothetical protein
LNSRSHHHFSSSVSESLVVLSSFSLTQSNQTLMSLERESGEWEWRMMRTYIILLLQWCL